VTLNKLFAARFLTSLLAAGCVSIFKVSIQCRSGLQIPVRFYPVLQSLLKGKENNYFVFYKLENLYYFPLIQEGPSFCCDALGNVTLSQFFASSNVVGSIPQPYFEDALTL